MSTTTSILEPRPGWSRHRPLSAAAPQPWKIVRSVLASAACCLLFVFGTIETALSATNATHPDAALVSPDAEKSGSLLVKTDRGYIEAIRVKTDVDVSVSGPTARARVTQIFRNPTNGWIEGVYVYPLPEGGAVDTMKMVIGKRVIVADVAERETARAAYQAARLAGQKAALTEEDRPNIFTNSVANIGPGESVVVQIEYQEPVRKTGDQFSVRVPLVVAPRYNPAPVAQQVDFSSSGWSQPDPVADRARIEPPVLDRRADAPENPVTVILRLRAGFPLGEVRSATHTVKIDTPSADERLVTLADPDARSDRDFELVWTPAPGATPSVGLLREHVGTADYLLAFVSPPALAVPVTPPAREVTFVIDNSGSMAGTSIEQAKESLIFALERLRPSDRFNVIRFDHTMTLVFPDTVPADSEHLAQAKAYVSSLRAAGGTEMVPPMKAALSDSHPRDTHYLRQVVFLTDGEIGNEQQIFDVIAEMRGRSRLFMVGIGSSPNGHLMSRAAEIGRGSYTAISSVDQVQERMQALVQKLESPAVTGLKLTFSVPGADITPAVLPDLYRGEPVVLAARLGNQPGKPLGTIEIGGMIGEAPWRFSLPLDKAAPGAGLSKLWARRKIDDAEVARTMGQMSGAKADEIMLRLGLEHHLVTRLTSLVAVDKTPSRPANKPLTRADIPLELPAGWDFDKVFGTDSDRPFIRRVDLGTGGVIQSAMTGGVSATSRRVLPQDRVPSGASSRPILLPKTATDAELRLVAGLALLELSLLSSLFIGSRRRARA